VIFAIVNKILIAKDPNERISIRFIAKYKHDRPVIGEAHGELFYKRQRLQREGFNNERF